MKICGSHRHSYPNGDLVKDKRIAMLEAALRDIGKLWDEREHNFTGKDDGLPYAMMCRAREALPKSDV